MAHPGRLRLGTLAGAARFDDTRLTVFDSGNTPEIQGSCITALVEDREGERWIGTDSGGITRRSRAGTLPTSSRGSTDRPARVAIEVGQTPGLMNALRWGLVLLAGIALAGFLVLLFVANGFRKWFGTSAAKRVPAGAEWRAVIVLERRSETNPDHEMGQLKVVLHDAKGRETETPDVALALNGTPVEYRVSRGNYYDRHPYFRLDESGGFRFEPAADYTLTLRRGGGAEVPFATLRTPKPLSVADLSFPRAHRRGGDLVLAWTALPEPADLLVYRSFTFVDEHGNQAIEAGGPYGDDVLRARAGEKRLPLTNGRYVIPASYVGREGQKEVSSVTVEVRAVNAGRYLAPVLPESEIEARRVLVLRADVTDP